MADQEHRSGTEEQSGGGEGFVESTVRRATDGSTGDDPAPPDEPTSAAMPRRNDAPDEDQ